MLYEFLKENPKESKRYCNLNLHILANLFLLLEVTNYKPISYIKYPK